VLHFVKTQASGSRFSCRDRGWPVVVLHRFGAAPIVSSDGLLYISNADQITSLHGLVDPKRWPPAIAILLSGIFSRYGAQQRPGGRDRPDSVLHRGNLETYFLLRTLMLPRALAVQSHTLLRGRAVAVQWERYILTRPFRSVARHASARVHGRLIRKPSTRSALVCGLVGAAIPITRPALALVPATLFVILVLRSSSRPGSASHEPPAGDLSDRIRPGLIHPCRRIRRRERRLQWVLLLLTTISNLNLYRQDLRVRDEELPGSSRISAIQTKWQSYSQHQIGSCDARSGVQAQDYAPLWALRPQHQFWRYRGQTLHLTIDEIRMVLTLDIHRGRPAGASLRVTPTIPICLSPANRRRAP